jgi:hypothetical protein
MKTKNKRPKASDGKKEVSEESVWWKLKQKIKPISEQVHKGCKENEKSHIDKKNSAQNKLWTQKTIERGLTLC